MSMFQVMTSEGWVEVHADLTTLVDTIPGWFGVIYFNIFHFVVTGVSCCDDDLQLSPLALNLIMNDWMPLDMLCVPKIFEVVKCWPVLSVFHYTLYTFLTSDKFLLHFYWTYINRIITIFFSRLKPARTWDILIVYEKKSKSNIY